MGRIGEFFRSLRVSGSGNARVPRPEVTSESSSSDQGHVHIRETGFRAGFDPSVDGKLALHRNNKPGEESRSGYVEGDASLTSLLRLANVRVTGLGRSLLANGPTSGLEVTASQPVDIDATSRGIQLRGELNAHLEAGVHEGPDTSVLSGEANLRVLAEAAASRTNLRVKGLNEGDTVSVRGKGFDIDFSA